MQEKVKKERPKRQKPHEAHPSQRSENFFEVSKGFVREQALKEAKRCLNCKNPKCIEGCPVEIDIPSFVAKISDGDFLGAARKIKEKNLLPAICGRVCPQEDQCEKFCVLGKEDDPLAIGYLERFAADWQRSEGKIEKPKIPPPTGRKVAVVGSGPAGLTAAGDLAKMGHKVTILEALHEPGGVFVYGIPEFRLPNGIVEAEIKFLKELGVKIRTSVVVGLQFTIDELFEQGYDAVFIGIGAGLPRFMNIDGENLNGVYSANEFLTRSNLMRAYLFPEYDTPIKRGKKVAVVGGGNVALDASRTALRLGADEVYLVYRRSEKEMPARDEEIKHAKEEGIIFRALANPVRILEKDGWVKALECIEMKLGKPDKSGRRRSVPIKGSEYQFDVDVVVIAIGTRANPLLLSNIPGLELNKWGYIDADAETGKTSKEGVFAGGDIVTGSATVILAMGAGRRAARAINSYLRNKTS